MLLNDKNNLVRLDKNLGYNITDFRKYDKRDQILLKNLIVYMSLNFQKNLFGFVTIDPCHFCKTMKYSRAELFRKHKDPLFFKVNNYNKKELLEKQEKYGTMSEYRVWDSNLENALFILKYEHILSTYKSSNEYENRISIEDFSYIKKLHITFQKKNKTKKILYEYEPTPEFEHSLRKFFFTANVKTYIKLRRYNLDDWYLNLLNRINKHDMNGYNELRFSINDISKYLNISSNALSEDSNIKKGFSDVKKKINYKFKHNFIPHVTDEINNLTLDWQAGNGCKYKNVAIVRWRSKTQEELKIINKEIYDDLFITELFKDLSSFYHKTYSVLEYNLEKKTNLFLKWLFSYTDADIKISKYISNYSDHKGRTDNLNAKATKYITNLSQLMVLMVQKQFVRYDNEKFLLYSFKEAKYIEYNSLHEVIFLVQKHSKDFANVASNFTNNSRK